MPMPSGIGIIDLMLGIRSPDAKPSYEYLRPLHIITITNDILKKVPLVGKDLTQLSLETVQMFYSDAQSAGYKI